MVNVPVSSESVPSDTVYVITSVPLKSAAGVKSTETPSELIATVPIPAVATAVKVNSSSSSSSVSLAITSMLVVAASSKTVSVSATAIGRKSLTGFTVMVNVPVSSVSVPSDTV